jgi:D-alanyl-D-alanine carboxypeptidase
MTEGFGFLLSFVLSFFHPAPAAAVPAAIPPPLAHIQIDSSYSAKSALLFDASSGERALSYNAENILPIASVSKIMSARVILTYLDPDATVAFTPNAIATEGIIGNFMEGEKFLVRDLLSAALMSSSNDAVVALAERTGEHLGGASFDEKINRFVEAMNKEASSLGMKHTTFRSPTGLDTQTGEATNVSTANDLARLMTASLATPLVWELSRDGEKTIVSLDGRTHSLINLNQLRRRLPYFIGGKTGSTDIAGESVVTLFEYPLGRKFGFILLDARPPQRFIEAEKLLAQFAPMLP